MITIVRFNHCQGTKLPAGLGLLGFEVIAAIVLALPARAVRPPVSGFPHHLVHNSVMCDFFIDRALLTLSSLELVLLSSWMIFSSCVDRSVLPSSHSLLEKVGVKYASQSGDVATKVLRFSPLGDVGVLDFETILHLGC